MERGGTGPQGARRARDCHLGLTESASAVGWRLATGEGHGLRACMRVCALGARAPNRRALRCALRVSTSKRLLGSRSFTGMYSVCACVLGSSLAHASSPARAPRAPPPPVRYVRTTDMRITLRQIYRYTTYGGTVYLA